MVLIRSLFLCVSLDRTYSVFTPLEVEAMVKRKLTEELRPNAGA